MKTNTKTIVAISIVALIVIVGGIVYFKAVKALPPDDVDAKLMRFDGVNGHRYTETVDNGNVTITQDDLGNTYDRVGGPYSNFKP